MIRITVNRIGSNIIQTKNYKIHQLNQVRLGIFKKIGGRRYIRDRIALLFIFPNRRFLQKIIPTWKYVITNKLITQAGMNNFAKIEMF